jgi:hypothetical protein
MKDLSFWAQSLDNQAPDMIFKNGEELFNDELRQKLVSEIYEVPKSSIEVLSADSSVTVRYSDPKFVIEAIPSEKDQVNRLAPIVIYGVLPDDWSENWTKAVCSEIEDFVSSKLNRTLDGRALAAIQNWLNETLKKKTDLQSTPLNKIKSFLVHLAEWLKAIVDKLFKSY